jgi:NAD+ diphosphatase
MSPRPDLGPRPQLGFAASPIDRAANLRTDAAALAALEADARAGTYVIGGELVVTKKNGTAHEPLFGPRQAAALGQTTESVFLGLVDGAPRFGVGIDAGSIESLKQNTDYVVSDLRAIAVQGLVAPHHLPPLAEAKSLLHWHDRHRFCSNCGAPTRVVESGWRRDCPQCNGQHFPRTDPVVIMLAVDGERCLLGRQSRFPQGMWSCLAGFLEPGESIEDAVRRETQEEAGVACGRIRYLASQPWPYPTSLMIGCHAEAVSRDITVDRQELEDARWFGREEAAMMLVRQHPDKLGTPPPFAIAHHIIRAWVERDIAFD